MQDFIPIWVGEEYLMDTGTVAAVLFTFYLSTIVAPVWMYRETLGLFRQMKYVMFMTALVNILLSILLGHFFGVAGIIGATGLARLCTIFWYEPKVLFHRTFGRSAAAYFKAQGGLAAAQRRGDGAVAAAVRADGAYADVDYPQGHHLRGGDGAPVHAGAGADGRIPLDA